MAESVVETEVETVVENAVESANKTITEPVDADEVSVCAKLRSDDSHRAVEAQPGIEPRYTDLQSAA